MEIFYFVFSVKIGFLSKVFPVNTLSLQPLHWSGVSSSPLTDHRRKMISLTFLCCTLISTVRISLEIEVVCEIVLVLIPIFNLLHFVPPCIFFLLKFWGFLISLTFVIYLFPFMMMLTS